MLSLFHSVSSFFRRHPFSGIFFSLLALFILGSAGLECVKIDVRFFFMTGDMTANPIGPFPTIFGSPYPDYPSTLFILSWLATACGHIMARWTVTLPSMICGAYSIAMTYEIGERAEKGLGKWALILSLLSFEYYNVILGFGIDLPVCAAAVTMIRLLQEERLHPATSAAAFAILLAFCFAVRGPMGPVLLGAGTAGWLAMGRRWKTFLFFGVIGAVVLTSCICFAWLLLHLKGGDELWDLFYTWQFGNRMDGGSPTFYLLGSIPTYAPLSFPFVYTLIAGRRGLLKEPVGPWLGFVFAVEILLTIPGCQHTRYMTLALPFMALAGAWGILHARLPLNLPKKNMELIRRFARLLLTLIPYAAAVGIIVCLAVSFFFISPGRIPYSHFVGGVALIGLSLYLFRKNGTWFAKSALAAFAMACFFILGVIPTISVREDSRPFVEAIEKASGSDRVFFFNVDADHDGIKYLAEVGTERRLQCFFICDEDQYTDQIYAYRTVEEGFDMLRDELVIIKKKKLNLETLTRNAEAAGRKVVPQFEGKLGHRLYLAVRLPHADPAPENAGTADNTPSQVRTQERQ